MKSDPGKKDRVYGWLVAKPVSRCQYIVAGVVLAILKYSVELAVVKIAGGGFYSPWAFLVPLVHVKESALAGAGDYVTLFLLSWSFPFACVALLLTICRCMDCGINPWHSFWIVCPFLNLVAILVFSILPSRHPIPASESPLAWGDDAATLMESVFAVAIGIGICFVLMMVSIHVFNDYGGAVFFGAPMIIGAIAGYRMARYHGAGLGHCLGVSILAVVTAEMIFLMGGLEGAICLLMAAPILIGSGMIGGAVGFAIARSAGQSKAWYPAMAVLPAFAGVEHYSARPVEYEVVTSVEIAASPETVWKNVIEFPEITSPPSGFFALGVSRPVRARIEGTGVGAIRTCEFTTGDFVEPITRWDSPCCLAFDVLEQPVPLVEWSPWGSIHPPHLRGFMNSHRGEFRLVRLPGNKTRLEGRTWYSVDMYPQIYWRLWTDSLIHAIHNQVLEHIRDTVQASASNNP